MKLKVASLRGCGIGLALAAACACQPRLEETVRPPSARVSPPQFDRSAPTLQELKNARYSGVGEASTFTLTDGRWEGAPFQPGAASKASVTFVRDFRLAGDLNGDGIEEAVVLLAASAGGTGETSYLAVAGRAAGQVTSIATAPVGDRVQVRDARIAGRRIVLDVVQAGRDDAACCPGDLVTRSWELAGGALREGAPVGTGRLSIDALAGAEWVLQAWAWNEAAPATPEVTLKLDANRLAGSAGCNSYFASVRPGSSPGALTVGPAGATRMMCSEAAMAVETRFLQQLGGVTQLRFVAGRMALTYTKADKTLGEMLFDRRAAR